MMFGDTAVELIRMLGATGNVPGALAAGDIPSALRQLREKLQVHGNGNSTPSTEDEIDDTAQTEPHVSLATRALPLIHLLERAAAAQAPVMWEKA